MDKVTEAPPPMDNNKRNRGKNGNENGSQTHSKRRADIFAKCHELTEPGNIKAQELYPYFRTIEATYRNQVICGGRRKIMIGSNNYLGLAQDERVIDAAQLAARKYGSGCTGSRILNGNIRRHEQLE